MAQDLEQLVLTISADTRQMQRALTRLVGDTNAAAKKVSSAFDGASAGLDRATTSTTKLQRQIEALAGVRQFGDRSQDIKAYGDQLDALRAKYNPLFAAQQQYTKTLSEINQAARVGAISEKERAAALAKTKSAFADQVKSIRSGGAANSELAQTGKLATYEMVNLSRQIQDVGVQLAGGQGLFTIIAQQGPQIADVFSSSKTGTVGGAIKQIGSGIASVITPMRLLGVGVAATGIAAYAAYGNWKSFTLQLDDTARIVGTTTGSLSKLQAAAAFKGIDGADFNKGIQAFGQSVYEAQNNMGSLAEAFRANNTHAKTFDEYLERAADLIQRAGSTQKQLSLLQQMGLPATMEWVKLLSGGADGLNKAKNAAAEFAANDDMVKKAREFDEAWNKAWTNFGLNARSAFQTALSAGLSLFDRMEKLAQSAGNASFWKGLYSEKSAAASGVTLLSGFDARFSGDSKNPVSANGALADALSKRAAALSAGPPTVDPNVLKDQISKGQQYLGLLGQTITATEARRQVELQLQAAALNGVTIDGKRAEVLKKLAEENILGITAMKQQADSLRVEAATFGMTTGQATAYVAAQNALNEARRNGRALTQDNIAAINAEAAALGKAAQAAANAQIANQIDFGRKTAFLSQDDVAIAQTLAAKFGNDVPAALVSSDAAALKLNKTFSDISSSLQSGLVTGLSDIIDGTKSASQGFADLGKSILRTLEEAIVKMAIVAPLMRALQGGLGGLIPGLGAGLSIPKFATGTSFAPGGLALVGERGPEVVNLPRGSQVIPNHQLQNGGGNTSIVINNNTPAQVQAREVVDGRGNRSIQVTVDEMVASSLSRPGSAARGAMRNNYGASPVGVRR